MQKRIPSLKGYLQENEICSLVTNSAHISDRCYFVNVHSRGMNPVILKHFDSACYPFARQKDKGKLTDDMVANQNEMKKMKKKSIFYP